MRKALPSPAFLVTVCALITFLPMRASACRGPQTEHAQKTDATTVFEGRLTKYSYNSPSNDGGAELTFEVTRTVRGESRKSWTVLMRGARQPANEREYVKRFGSNNEVGIRPFKKDKTMGKLFYIVDNACKMNRDDWFIYPFRSFRSAEVELGVETSASQHKEEVKKAVQDDLSSVADRCTKPENREPGRRSVHGLITTRGPGQFLESKIVSSEIPDKTVLDCIQKAQSTVRIPWVNQNLDDLVKTNVTYTFTFCNTDSSLKCPKP
jgi:hypothetical protein